MKQTKLLALTLFFLTCFSAVKAGETEPNNTKATANTLTLNGNNTGAVGVANDEDWWAVTTNADGKLNVTIAVSNGLYTRWQIYDNDGIILIDADYTSGTKTLSVDGLATGTYYVRVYAYYAGQLPAYTISNTLTLPAVSNDSEPNDTKAKAKTLNVNNSKDGHIGYYYNNLRDSFDWYKITLAEEGRLRVNLTSHNGQHVYAYLYDNDGVTDLGHDYTNGTKTVINADGLAAGTYYIMVRAYYNTGFVPYTLADSLFTPAQAPDNEPNNTPAQAATLQLNSSTTGRVGYYYNNLRDTFDWYKVTLNEEGRLRVTLTSHDGQHIYAHLYDNNGITVLSGDYTNGTKAVINTDGLAAGTYYIRIRAYYTYGFIPYTLADSLFTPEQGPDNEPNNTSAAAVTFPLNTTFTGRINYYYNNLRDTFDWYKITIPLDGMINLTMTSGNGQYIKTWVFDNDGTTQLNYMETNNTKTIMTDGLAAGTYYVRVMSYYSSGYIPYTLSNAFTTYTYTNDGASEPNDAPYQAKVFNSNDSITGHVSFYQNGNTRNGVDWWKLYYSGTGNLTIKLYDEGWKVNGATHYKKIWIYKDTAATQIYYAQPNSGLLTINLTSLAEGPYWIRVQSYYGDEHIAYALTNSYTEVAPKPKSVEGDTATTCQSKNTVAFKISKSTGGPYNVQLYRYGTAYGSPISVPDKKKFSYKNLAQGSYYITAQAVGSAIIATSKEVEVMTEPTGTNTSGVASTQAVANWTILSCAKYYNVQYRVHGTLDWTKKKTNGNVGNYTIKNLTPNTQYDWQVSAVDSANGADANSAYTDSLEFTTTAAFATSKSGVSSNDIISNVKQVSIFPNPAISYFVIRTGIQMQGIAYISLIDMNGKVQLVKTIDATQINGYKIETANMQSGMYMLQIKDKNNKHIATEKILIKQ